VQTNIIVQTNVSIPSFVFKKADYDAAVRTLQLALIQEVDPDKRPPRSRLLLELNVGTLGGRQKTDKGEDPADGYNTIWFTQMLPGEGDTGTFTILQSSFEDAQGVFMMQKIKSNLGLLSNAAFNALMMVDICNPIYSWRRGLLMQYVPPTTTYDKAKNKYDLEDNFIANVKNSNPYKTQDGSSPEFQFITLIGSNISTLQARFNSYLAKVSKRLSGSGSQQAVLDYMILAESRRRVYRPLPLDEFGLSLPYSLYFPYNTPFEMTEEGTIAPVPDRGVKFLLEFIGSLSGFDPKVIPLPETVAAESLTWSPAAAMAPTAFPAPNNISRSCESSTFNMQRQRASQCPVLRRKGERKPAPSPMAESTMSPTWNDDIRDLFAKPYWLGDEKESVGKGWIGAMKHFGWNLDLSQVDDVQKQAVVVYQHLRSRSMPISSDPRQFWPDEALETYRAWVNQGCRVSTNDPIYSTNSIPPPSDNPVKIRVRKDVRNLTADEIQLYRSKIQNVLQVDSVSSKWQELGKLHAFWCLHYQEATFMWHRAYLRYVEELIDFPIPYWNGFASDTVDPKSPAAGLPSLFTDDTYVDLNGKTQQNPLKYAVSYNGVAKAGGKYISRDPTLEQGPGAPGWNTKISWFNLYHTQLKTALTQATYSAPQGIGVAWAALPAFGENMPDEDYEGHRMDFDGLFEQVHDNFHGWIGGLNGDMVCHSTLTCHSNLSNRVNLRLIILIRPSIPSSYHIIVTWTVSWNRFCVPIQNSYTLLTSLFVHLHRQLQMLLMKIPAIGYILLWGIW
jgi:hypothetical protein